MQAFVPEGSSAVQGEERVYARELLAPSAALPRGDTMLQAEPLDTLPEPLPFSAPVLKAVARADAYGGAAGVAGLVRNAFFGAPRVPATETERRTVISEVAYPTSQSVRPQLAVNQLELAAQTAPGAQASVTDASLATDPAVSAGVSNVGLIIAAGVLLSFLMLKKKRLA